jgi:hypothetical protein
MRKLPKSKVIKVDEFLEKKQTHLIVCPQWDLNSC